MIWRKAFWVALVAGALAASGLRALAVEALTFPDGPASGVAGGLNGGPGWSFVPTTNITVTSVAYLDLATAGGDPNVVVTIWDSTNTVLAAYTGITDPSAQQGDLVYGTVAPLGLSAGQTYTITANTAPLSESSWLGALHDNSGAVDDDTFQLAAQLTQFQAWQFNPDGTFSPLTPDPTENQQLLWLGPTFTYQLGLPPPTLTIALTNSESVVLSWPTNAVGYVLQTSLAVTGSYANVTNSPAVSGVRYVVTLPNTNPAAFFRLKM